MTPNNQILEKLPVIFPNQRFNLSLLHRKFFLNACPEQVPVNTKIPMSDDIPHAGNTAPVNFRVMVNEITREVFGCFADNLDIAEDRIANHVIFYQLVVCYAPGKFSIFPMDSQISKRRRRAGRFSDINNLLQDLIADERVESGRSYEIDLDAETFGDPVPEVDK